MVTASAKLRRRSEVLMYTLIAVGLPTVLLAYLSWATPSGWPIATAWAKSNWWVGVTGVVVFYLVSMLARLWLRCPYCRYSLPHLGMGPRQFLSSAPKAKYCPRCGQSFDTSMPSQDTSP